MNRFVVDCSVVMAWCFEDEFNPYADAVLNMFKTSEAVVPSIWPLEVANVLLVGERRRRLTIADSQRFLALLGGLPITIDEETPHKSLKETLVLARKQNLSSYDATYLELSVRQGLPLATMDLEIKKAARSLGVPLINGLKRR